MSGGLGRGLRSFVDGAVAGAELKNKWGDRKRRQKIEDEELEWDREDRKIAAEDRARLRAKEDEDLQWQREDRQHTRRARGIIESERQRLAKIRDEDNAVFADNFERSKAQFEKETTAAAKEAVPLGATLPKLEVEPLPGGALDKALKTPEAERPAQKPARSIIPTSRTKDDAVPKTPTPVDPSAPVAEAPSIADATANQQASLLSKFNPFGAAAAAEVPTRDQAAGQAAQAQAANVPGAGVGDYAAAVAAPVVKAGRSLYDAAAGAGGRVVDAAREKVVPEAMRAAGSPAAAPAAQAPVATPTPAAPAGPATPDPMQQAIAMSNGQNVQPQQGYVPMPGASPATPARPVPPGAGGEPSAAPGVPGAALASASPPPKAMVPSDVPNAAQAPVTPSVEIAAATSGRVDTNGMRRERSLSTPAKPDTPSESQVKARTFMQIWRKEAVPEIVNHYLKRGDLERAKAFDTWAKSEDTREGMEAWAKGVHAATAGDEEGFLDSMIDAYNADGYYDDGYEIDRKGSGFTKSPKGDIIGGQITLRDKRTGATRVQTFDDTEDLWEMGVNQLSPESVFETGLAQVESARAFEKTQAEEELKHQRAIELEGVKAGFKGKTPEEEIAATYEALSKEDPMGNGFNALPEAEKQKAVLARIQSMRSMSLGQVPATRSQVPVAPVNF